MKITLNWEEDEDYKGHLFSKHTQSFIIRDFWLPFIRQILVTFEREE